MVCWGEDGEWGGKVLQVGGGEEGEEWGSVEFGSVEFMRGVRLVVVDCGYGWGGKGVAGVWGLC